MTLLIDRIDSPIGVLTLVSDGKTLRALSFETQDGWLDGYLAQHFADREIVPTQDPNGFSTRLRAYLAGDLNAIDDIPAQGVGSDFQRAVWAALREIPVGTTTTYGALARKLGQPVSASRAVGLANGSNPIAIVVPCHRVIGANDRLVGFGGGLARKQWLLGHERFELPLGLPVDRRASG